MNTHAEAGACGLRMLDGSGRFLPESKRGFPSLKASFYKLSGLAKLFPRSKRFASYYLGHLNDKETHEVDVLTGAFFMTTKEVLEKTGGFDEQFFMYGEDIDLSYRIQQAGYKIYYLSASTIIHFKGESTKKGSLNYLKLFYQAMSIFFKKHYSRSRSRIFSYFIQMSIWFRASLSVIGNLYKRKRQRNDREIVRTMVMGSQNEANEVLPILTRQTSSSRKVSFIETEAGAESITTHNPDEIIFCEGELSYRKIIQIMQQLPSNISFRIHAAGSGSIVSSDSKNTSGNVLI